MSKFDFQQRSLQSHREFNRQTSSLRQSYQAQRATLRNCVVRAAQIAMPRETLPAGEMVWLGAGNCNDLDLSDMLSTFEEVHLVDIDQEAIEYGVSQVDSNDGRLHLHVPVDVAAPLLSLSDLPEDEQSLSALAEVPEDLPVTGCDVVLSAGLLSQLMLTLAELRELQSIEDQAFFRLIQSVRRGHFRRIAAMLRPGGVGVITLELVASDLMPELLKVDSADQQSLQQLAAQAAAENRYLMGMNPAIALAELSNMPFVTDIVPSLPWTWRVGARVYLVSSIIFRKK